MTTFTMVSRVLWHMSRGLVFLHRWRKYERFMALKFQRKYANCLTEAMGHKLYFNFAMVYLNITDERSEPVNYTYKNTSENAKVVVL